MTQRILKYTLAVSDTESTHYINLAQHMSALNRQLFRQCRNYHIKSISINDDDNVGSAPDAYVQIGGAPWTWVQKNALKRGFEKWNEMNNIVLQGIGQKSLKGKWHDFKPYLSYKHYEKVNDGSSTIETPEDMHGNKLQLGSWEYSKFETPDATTGSDMFQVALIGDHAGSAGAWQLISLTQSYGETRGNPYQQVPTVDSDARDDALLNLIDDGTQTDEITENLLSDGSVAPYQILNDGQSGIGELYVGSRNNMPQEQFFGECNFNVYNPNNRFYNIQAPLGILRVDCKSEDTTNITIIVELAPGGYKGIEAESLL